jgi:hypothetical protein
VAKTPVQLIEFIDTRLGEYAAKLDSPGIEAARARTLQQIRTFLLAGRFPTTESERYELSLIPFILQEANYDGIDWGPGTAKYGHLQDLFDLDFYVALGGRERSEVTDKEANRYWRTSDRFISRRSGEPAGSRLLKNVILWLLRLWYRK